MKEKVNITFCRDNEAVEIQHLAEVLGSEMNQDDDEELVADSSVDNDSSYPPLVIGDVRNDSISVNSFVLVEFASKRSSLSVYYIGKVMSVESDDVIVSFLRKSHKWVNKFVYPIVEDIHPVSTKDIHAILPAPLVTGTTARTMNSVVAFPVSITNLNIR